MAYGNFLLHWHGPGSAVSRFHEEPDMYVNISYNILRNSSDRNVVSGTVSASLQGLGGESYFGYSITCSTKIVQDVYGATQQLFHKPNTPNRWSSGVYAGSANIWYTDTTNSVVTLRIYFDSNCPCYGTVNYYDITLNIGSPYTTPNISITSINGVNIPTGSGNYNININGDQNITIGYSAWSGAISNDSCSINAWIRPYDRSRNLSYKTIRNDGNGKPAGSSLYRTYNNANDPATPIGSGVPFAYDNQQVWIYAQRHHSSTGSNSPEVLHSNVRLMRILYTPIKSITFTKQPIGLYESRQSIDISWSYPTPPSLIDQYGIVSGYEIRLINKDTGQTELIDSTVSTSYTLASNDYNPLTRYCFQILPYYLNGESKSYGPSKNSNDFMLITKLSPPTINYPNTGTNCVWIGNKLYVLAQLPFDPDASYVESYEYKNLEVTINGVTYTFESNSDMFSIGNLTHNAKFVFTTKNINIPFSTSYIIKTRVQKNYSFDGIDYRWSEYSTIELSSVQVPSIPTYSGYVMASHYNSIYTYVRNMRNCYIESNDSVLTTSKSRGIQINRSNFQNIYNDLNGISQLIDQWGEYSKDLKVEFSQNNLFSPKIEYITDKKNDTDPTGNNYFILSYEWIRYYG